ncbi:MAG: transforming growth factor-beta-induced protein [Planctomycetota bacterium]|jgi:transforming growth factor-beta-induced protein
MQIKTTLAVLTAITFMFAGQIQAQCCNSSNDGAKLISKAKAEKDIVDTAVADGRFKTLVAAVQTAKLVDTLKGKGPFTVFAPTDSAFAALPKGTVAALLKPEMRGRLTAILTWHVTPGAVAASKVLKGGFLPTVNGQRLPITLSGDSVSVGGAKIIITDIKCSNGVIHVISSVMLPADKNIVATAKSTGMFNTLLAAATHAGLVPALTGKGPLTVFAPTDAAFAALPKGTVESLLLPQNKAKLVAILKYHVVSGRLYSDRLVKSGSAKTLQGKAVTVKVVDGKALANKATLLKTDIETSNGVIHVVDQVLLP